MLRLTSDDFITIVLHSDRFDKILDKRIGEKIMALKQQIEEVDGAIAELNTKVEAERQQVRDLVQTTKDELNVKIAELEAAVAELDGTSLSAQIQGLKDAAANVDKISEVVDPVPPVEPVEPTEPTF